MSLLNLLAKSFRYIERKFARLQGKGWGSKTVKNEFALVASMMLETTPNLCVDIGGNKGLYADEILRRYPTSEVIIFEPA